MTRPDDRSSESLPRRPSIVRDVSLTDYAGIANAYVFGDRAERINLIFRAREEHTDDHVR